MCQLFVVIGAGRGPGWQFVVLVHPCIPVQTSMPTCLQRGNKAASAASVFSTLTPKTPATFCASSALVS